MKQWTMEEITQLAREQLSEFSLQILMGPQTNADMWRHTGEARIDRRVYGYVARLKPGAGGDYYRSCRMYVPRRLT